MKCPFCGYLETKVIDSRATEAGDAIRRRRECLECQRRFTTYERQEEIPLMVIKKNGQREPFDRAKLLKGLQRATVKREITLSQLENIVTDIESELRNQFKYEVPSKEIGEMALKRLREIDKVAYVRFASVYREFKDIDEFTAELAKLHRNLDKK
ncbi:MAG: transcriptional regulator NrdR [Actinomycetota bacterium]|nr:transcriptional regulator NrdR [Actinomycetota bacterium]MDI6822316.1 transcriptional regulator NrdR [Actinomycetota bacterium]